MILLLRVVLNILNKKKLIQKSPTLIKKHKLWHYEREREREREHPVKYYAMQIKAKCWISWIS